MRGQPRQIQDRAALLSAVHGVVVGAVEVHSTYRYLVATNELPCVVRYTSPKIPGSLRSVAAEGSSQVLEKSEILATKDGLTRSFFDATDDEVPIGTFALASLPEKLFRLVVAQHNEKVEHFAAVMLKRFAQLRLEQLHIPTYEEFQERLAKKELRDRIPAQHRKIRDFGYYRSWVLAEAPISTVLRDTFFTSRFAAYASEYQRRRHTLVVGRSGSGKSEVLKLLALATKLRDGELRRNAALVLIDPHGDLAEQVARQDCFARDFEEHPQDPDLVYLDPFQGASSARFPTLNPLDVSARSYSDLQREKLAQQLMRVFKSLVVRDDYSLTLNMETLLVPCLNALLNRPGSTFFDLLRFLDDDANTDLVELGRQLPNPGHRSFFESSFRATRFDVTKGALSTKVQALLNSRAFATFLAQPQSTVDLEELVNNGKTVVLNCAVGKSGADTGEALGRFLIGIILGIAFNRAENPQGSRTPIWLFIDEMQRFVSDELRVILSEARKYGLHLTLATQVVGQGMSSELTRVVLGNTAVQMIGGAGNDSQAVMAREMGVRTESLENLAVGEFAVKFGTAPPIRVRMSPRYLGRRTQMTIEQWRSVQRFQLEHYYRSESESTSAGNEAEEVQVASLRGDILAASPIPRTSSSGRAQPSPLDTSNPFVDLPNLAREDRNACD